MNIPPAKISFIDLFRQSQIGLQNLINKAKKAGVAQESVEAMIVGSPVASRKASAVITILSQYTGKTYTLDNVEVSTLVPRFQDLYVSRGFDTVSLSQESGVPLTVIDQMLRDEPVPKGEALRVLQALSELFGELYTLDEVAIKVREEGKRG